MKIIYSIVIIIFTAANALAQVAVTRSSEKVKINGDVFYAHQVKKKETLYSLGKAYDVTVEDIIKYNQEVSSGLKEGSILYIPAKEKTDSAKDKTVSAKDKPTSTVKDKQGAANGKKYKKHIVKWYEDIADISEKYNVPAEALIALNQLETGKLKSRQILLIPDREYLVQNNFATTGTLGNNTDSKSGADTSIASNISAGAASNNKSDIASSTASSTTSNAVSDVTDSTGNNAVTEDSMLKPFIDVPASEPIEIAYILPLNSRDTNNINTNFMDFYAGALLAVNDWKKEGNSLTVNIYDQNDYSPLHTLIDASGFCNNRLIIGPARSNILKNFTGYSLQQQIPLVSPLDNSAEQLAENNPYFIQMPSNSEAQIVNTLEMLERYMVQDSVSTVLLIYEKDNSSDTLYVNSAKRILESKGIAYTPISYGILDGREIYTTMLAKVDTLSAHPHIALVPSNSEAFVSDVVRNLDLCSKSGAGITLFGLPKWRNFETINIELFHKMQLHLSLPYFVDYNNGKVKRFLLQYRALYSAEPSPYAFQGYDITKYMLELMKKYGRSFVNANATERTGFLQSDFELIRVSPYGGLKNRATRNIVYNPDLTIGVLE